MLGRCLAGANCRHCSAALSHIIREPRPLCVDRMSSTQGMLTLLQVITVSVLQRVLYLHVLGGTCRGPYKALPLQKRCAVAMRERHVGERGVEPLRFAGSFN